MERRFFMIIKIFADKNFIIINHNHHKKSAFYFQELLIITNQLKIALQLGERRLAIGCKTDTLCIISVHNLSY